MMLRWISDVPPAIAMPTLATYDLAKLPRSFAHGPSPHRPPYSPMMPMPMRAWRFT